MDGKQDDWESWADWAEENAIPFDAGNTLTGRQAQEYLANRYQLDDVLLLPYELKASVTAYAQAHSLTFQDVVETAVKQYITA